MGIHNPNVNVDVPKLAEYKVERTIINNSEVVELCPSSLEKRGMFDAEEQEEEIERITRFKSVQWGDYHGLLLDKKGRLFGMGKTDMGLLGLSEK
jgi:alpha-tubulin suppressor-like RCC1 family protein